MSPEEFDSLRTYQMAQLYQAYRDDLNGRNYKQLRIRSTDTSLDSVRRVTGDRPGHIHNTGILALNNEDVALISQIARTQSKSEDISYSQYDSISMRGLKTIVDEVLAAREVAGNDLQMQAWQIPLETITRDTHTLKRIMGRVANRNVFDLEDYNLNIENILSRKDNLLNRTLNKIAKSVDKFLHPNAERNDPNRFGNKEFGEDPRT